MSRSRQPLATLYALAAVGLWSTVATAFKLALGYLSPESLLFYASWTSLLLFAGLLWRQGRLGEAMALGRRHPWHVALLGAINPFLYYLSLFHAYDLLPAQEAQAINYSWGVLLTLLSAPILGQHLRRRDLIAGALCYLGVLIIATRGDLLSLHFHSLPGIGFALVSTLLWALYWLLNTRIEGEPLPLLFLNFLVGTLLLSLYLFISGKGVEVPALPGLAAALYVGLFEMGVTFMLWLRALKLTDSAARIATLIYLSPLLSLFFIHTILGETIFPSTLLALVLILGALWYQGRKG
jgi:drug/metabolite transporter (DMT)-like permease